MLVGEDASFLGTDVALVEAGKEPMFSDPMGAWSSGLAESKATLELRSQVKRLKFRAKLKKKSEVYLESCAQRWCLSYMISVKVQSK